MHSSVHSMTACLSHHVHSLFHSKTTPPTPPTVSIQDPPPPSWAVPHPPAACQLNESAPFANTCCNNAQDRHHQIHYVGGTVLCQGRFCISCNRMVLQRGQRLAGPCTERALGSQRSTAQFCGLANSLPVSRYLLLLLPLWLLFLSNRPITCLFHYAIGHLLSCINSMASETFWSCCSLEFGIVTPSLLEKQPVFD